MRKNHHAHAVRFRRQRDGTLTGRRNPAEGPAADGAVPAGDAENG